MKKLILTSHIYIHHMERNRHRISIDGNPLYYFAVIGRKNQGIPTDFLRSIGVG